MSLTEAEVAEVRRMIAADKAAMRMLEYSKQFPVVSIGQYRRPSRLRRLLLRLKKGFKS